MQAAQVTLPVHKDIVTTQIRLRDAIIATPILRIARLDRLANASLWLKAENLQVNGSFKSRGAYNVVAQLQPVELVKGLVTYSSGNHAHAVAWAAARFNASARIFMPVDAPAVKVRAARNFGAEVTSVWTTSLERQAAAQEFAASTGAILVEPFDNAQTIAGQGTASLELRQDVLSKSKGRHLDQLFVPVGGGGLIAGACLAFEGTKTEIISVEPEGCDSMNQSLRQGTIVAVNPGSTLADGLKPTTVGELNFSICQPRISASVLVDDEEMQQAMMHVLMWTKTVVEPSGAAALAAALKYSRPGAQVGVMLSGGNVSLERISELISNYL